MRLSDKIFYSVTAVWVTSLLVLVLLLGLHQAAECAWVIHAVAVGALALGFVYLEFFNKGNE